MAYSHVAHDCMVGNNNVFANNSGIAGHVNVGNYARWVLSHLSINFVMLVVMHLLALTRNNNGYPSICKSCR